MRQDAEMTVKVVLQIGIDQNLEVDWLQQQIPRMDCLVVIALHLLGVSYDHAHGSLVQAAC